MEIVYTRAFLKRLSKHEEDLQEIIFEKIEEFKNIESHRHLRVHKLHGKFSNCFSFSVNYKTRIVFEYISKDEAVLLSIGDHDIYN
jgi:mRNA-degrading endonuclease YafQ of YafQ-DinJ toxin-antitoxin module